MDNFLYVLEMMGKGILNLIPYALLATPLAMIITRRAIKDWKGVNKKDINDTTEAEFKKIEIV